MFERFTDRARVVLAEAGQLAKEFRSPAIRRHHLLMALIDAAHEGSGSVAAVLEDAGVDPGELRGALMSSLQSSETALPESGSKAPFTAEAKKSLELSLREALSLGHNYIGREHLLLGILRDPGDALSGVLSDRGLAHQRAREVIAAQSPPTRVAARSRRGFRATGRPRFGNSTPGLLAVFQRVQERVGGGRQANTGDFLLALLDTDATHFHELLANVQLPTKESLEARAQELVLEAVPDGADPLSVDRTTGAVTIRDPELLAEFNRAVGEGVPAADALVQILRRRQS